MAKGGKGAGQLWCPLRREDVPRGDAFGGAEQRPRGHAQRLRSAHVVVAVF